MFEKAILAMARPAKFMRILIGIGWICMVLELPPELPREVFGFNGSKLDCFDIELCEFLWLRVCFLVCFSWCFEFSWCFSSWGFEVVGLSLVIVMLTCSAFIFCVLCFLLWLLALECFLLFTLLCEWDWWVVCVVVTLGLVKVHKDNSMKENKQ